MWTIDRTLSATVRPRPIRIAYLIPQSAPHELVDSIVNESLSRWGGRRTPFIPTDGKSIEDSYWTFLDHWDADILYSYAELSDNLQDRLYYSFAPTEIVLHSEANNMQSHTPIFDYTFLSSLSILPFLDRTAQSLDATLPVLIDDETWEDADRDFADSFGFLSRSCLGADIHPHGRRISLKDEGFGRQSHASETDYQLSRSDWISTIAKKRSIVPLAALADMVCPNLRQWSNFRNGWNDHLTIVVGDSKDDRLLSWNAQHRYSALVPWDNVPILRLSPKRFENGIPDWIKEWLLLRNDRCPDHVNSKKVKLKSCSLAAAELLEIEEQLKAGYLLISSEHCESPNVLALQDKDHDSATWSSRMERTETVRFEANKFELPLHKPTHVQASNQKGNFGGIWAVDLTIDRKEDHSRISNMPHVWNFPRRLRLDTAVLTDGYAVDSARRFGAMLRPALRPSKNGDLIVWDSASWTRPVISMPTDYLAFGKALREFPRYSPALKRKLKTKGGLENPFSNLRVSRITISDKGRDLLGVLQFFNSLPEATLFLTNQLWCQVIETMLPAQAEDKKKYVEEIAKMIQSSYQKDDVEKATISRIAKRALEFASRSFHSQSMKKTDFDSIYQIAKAATQQESYPGNELKEDLVTSITYLRDKGFLWQGLYWKCSVCEHENWVSLERLTAVCFCQICRTAKSSPVTGSLHFRLNPFVQHAFEPTSAQGSVLWCLNVLASQAELRIGNRNSFAFTPAMDVYRHGGERLWTDLDIVASINGLVVVVEVKKSFAGVNALLATQLFEIGEMFRPDIVMLAVQAPLPVDQSILEPYQELRSKLKVIDVQFQLLSLSDKQMGLFDCIGIPTPFAKDMTWSAW
ncbi:MAG: hypothetical protein K2W95_20620 [Candidatus Obscuribacterales bacterium]|nr:hypothetical protein [Candidatus Obscuribacterales bacterium]